MSKLVVDASVAAKWLVTEPLSDKALDVLGSSDEYAPDLLLAEVGNILWKKARRGEVSPSEARRIAGALVAAPLRIHPAAPLLLGALERGVEDVVAEEMKQRAVKRIGARASDEIDLCAGHTTVLRFTR